jgi:hypothetical protein
MSSDEPGSRRYESTFLSVIDDVLHRVMASIGSSLLFPMSALGFGLFSSPMGYCSGLWRQVMILDLSYSPP